MNLVLLRVGIDTGSGGIHGPLYADGSFEFIPIPDGWLVDSRTYGNTVGRHGVPLAQYFPARLRERMRQQPMHVDPEFDTFTYGDPTPPKARLRELKRGDMLVFYAGLKGYDRVSPPALYIVGYFVVAAAGLATNFGEDILATLFSSNFHVMHTSVFADQRDRLVLVKGAPESRLLERAERISEIGADKSGKPIHVLSSQAREVFGNFGGHISIQRSPPRWVDASFTERAAAFIRSL